MEKKGVFPLFVILKNNKKKIKCNVAKKLFARIYFFNLAKHYVAYLECGILK
jgi:hypothetical protein